MDTTRRRLFALPAAAASLALAHAEPVQKPSPTTLPIDGLDLSLDGAWQFRVDAETQWRDVTVPHTWQVMDGFEDYRGVAHYRRNFATPAAPGDVFLEFESVFHTAEVRVNGKLIATHARKGYTAFRTAELSALLNRDTTLNTVEVRVDNSFDDRMLPRGRSSDWAHDGGIYRSVHLLVLPKTRIESLMIDAWPAAAGAAQCRVSASITDGEHGLRFDIYDESTGQSATPLWSGPRAHQTAGLATNVTSVGQWGPARTWHFDAPHLYRLVATLFDKDNVPIHRVSRTFGVRKFEVRDGGFYLNGERVRLMGVERMAGSHPDYGMAEPLEWIEHDNVDLRNLNCVFTRVHWMQDRRLLDWCDRHGMLVQLEVPTWGPDTFKHLTPELENALRENGLAQLREMIEQNRHHPSVVAWGLCNEIDGQNPPAANFARAMLRAAKELDPSRPCTYASHSLFKTPGKDVAREMDYVSWNQYYGSWQQGWTPELDKTLRTLLDEIPSKPVVISEYGYCACTADRPENDPRRVDVLRAQTELFRKYERIAGLIFFCYNDYRTHVGDRGRGALQQRVHGVVDVYGTRKPSYDALRNESSSIESLTASANANSVAVRLATRAAIPAYTLRNYTLELVVYGQGAIAVERQRIALPALKPGAHFAHAFTINAQDATRYFVDVRRPDGASARDTSIAPA